ncbi:MAG: MFS transporter [Candidatus Zixiibacteriota bacterium]|nr:MAG: MFS transporter [candidate division Zixibacteria bacterium]
MKGLPFNLDLLRPLQARDFRLLWVGQVIAWSGDSVYQIGLLWLILEMTGSQGMAGLIAAVGYLPALLLGLFLGALVDLWDRRRLMMAADLLRALALLYIPVAFLGGWLTPWQLAAAAFLISLGAALFNPARDASVPHLAPPEALLAANALVQTSAHAAMLLGPLFAGLILALSSLTTLFYADALAYLASFVTILLLRLPPLPRTERTVRPLATVLEGLRYARQAAWSGQLLVLTALDNFFIMGPAIVGTPIFVREELQLGPQAFAAIQACYAVGMLTGALLLGSLGHRLPKGRTLLVGMILDGITFIPLYFVPSLGWMAAAIVFHSLSIPLIMVPRAAMIQEGIPARLQGRFFALVNLTVVGVMALSSAATGVLCEAWGVRTVFLVIGLGGGLCGALGFGLKELRRRR